jgi:hypothetical protein
MSQNTPSATCRASGAAGLSAQRAAFDLCAGAIAAQMPTIAEIPQRDTLITNR